MKKIKKAKELKKELALNCPFCQKVYQLLEIHYQNKKDIKFKEKCLVNCSEKWNQILQDYHSKEIMAHLARQEQKDEASIDKMVESFLKSLTKKEKK